MSAASPRPWRKVIHIAEQAGKRGGKTWFLTLECGHHKPVPVPTFRSMFDMGKKKLSAPDKCRCQFCESVAEV